MFLAAPSQGGKQPYFMSFHSFLAHEHQRKLWIMAMSRDDGEGFVVKKGRVILVRCSHAAHQRQAPSEAFKICIHNFKRQIIALKGNAFNHMENSNITFNCF